MRPERIIRAGRVVANPWTIVGIDGAEPGAAIVPLAQWQGQPDAVGVWLVDRCVGFARAAGYAQVVLWTNDVLVEARRLYERTGFTLARRAEHRSFGRNLVGEDWTLDLAAT